MHASAACGATCLRSSHITQHEKFGLRKTDGSLGPPEPKVFGSRLPNLLSTTRPTCMHRIKRQKANCNVPVRAKFVLAHGMMRRNDYLRMLIPDAIAVRLQSFSTIAILDCQEQVTGRNQGSLTTRSGEAT